LGMKTRKTRRRRGGRTDCRVLRGGDGVAHAHVNNNKEVVTPGAARVSSKFGEKVGQVFQLSRNFITEWMLGEAHLWSKL
jgi:hypothetical protein